MSLESSLFANHARAKTYEFDCALDCTIGAYLLTPGDHLKAVDDGAGLYWLYVEWGINVVGRVPALTVNKLAGKEIISAHYVGGVR